MEEGENPSQPGEDGSACLRGKGKEARVHGRCFALNETDGSRERIGRI
jgi:hypothetical protein